jgi:hypothetical protein
MSDDEYRSGRSQRVTSAFRHHRAHLQRRRARSFVRTAPRLSGCGSLAIARIRLGATGQLRADKRARRTRSRLRATTVGGERANDTRTSADAQQRNIYLYIELDH